MSEFQRERLSAEIAPYDVTFRDPRRGFDCA